MNYENKMDQEIEQEGRRSAVVQDLYFDKDLVERLRLAVAANFIDKGQIYNMLNAGFITMKEYTNIIKN